MTNFPLSKYAWDKGLATIVEDRLETLQSNRYTISSEHFQAILDHVYKFAWECGCRECIEALRIIIKLRGG